MPWRTEPSARTSMPLNLTPRWLRICTTAAEKPHCGKTGVPFIKSTTGASPICWRMRSCTVLSISRSSFAGAAAQLLVDARFGCVSILGGAGLQCQRVQFVAHAALQCLVHQLVLLHPALAAEGAGDDMSGVVVAVAAQIFDRDLRVGQALLDEPLDHCRVHRHRSIPNQSKLAQLWFMYSGSQASCAALSSATDMAPAPGSVNAVPPTVPMRRAGMPCILAVTRSKSAIVVSIR